MGIWFCEEEIDTEVGVVVCLHRIRMILNINDPADEMLNAMRCTDKDCVMVLVMAFFIPTIF